MGSDDRHDRMWDAASYQFANVLNMSEDGRFVINT